MSDYRNGYADAKALIESLDNLSLARQAVPPAMSEDYKSGFIKACDDAAKRKRPNRNYVLDVMRDSMYDDPWGTAMAWAFACAENLAAIGADVPSEVGYQMSPMGPCIESYEDFQVAEFLGAIVDHDLEVAIFEGITPDETNVKEVQFALRCLHRYIDWCKAAGLDY